MTWMETTKQDIVLIELRRLRRTVNVALVLMLMLTMYGIIVTYILLLK